MKNVRFGVLAAALVVALVGVPAFAADVTVGQFLMEIAKAKSLTVTDAASAQASLRAAGVNVPRIDLAKALTEGDVAEISTAAGLRVTTKNPAAGFSQSQVSEFVASFGRELGATGPNRDRQGTRSHDGSGSNSSSGGGKKKGHNKSASDPV